MKNIVAKIITFAIFLALATTSLGFTMEKTNDSDLDSLTLTFSSSDLDQTHFIDLPNINKYNIDIVYHNYNKTPAQQPTTTFYTTDTNTQSIKYEPCPATKPYTADLLKKGLNTKLRIYIPSTYYANDYKYTTTQLTLLVTYPKIQKLIKPTFDTQKVYTNSDKNQLPADYEPQTGPKYVIITNETYYSIFKNHYEDWVESNLNLVPAIVEIYNVSDITTNSLFWVNGTYGDATNDSNGNPWIPDGKEITSHHPMFNDTQAQIRNFIRRCYGAYNTRYVLLAGNKNAVPPRMVCSYAYSTCPGCTGPKHDYSHASDMYYSCLHYCMNNNTNSYWMENQACDNTYDEIDWGYDLCVGRALFNTPTTAFNWINKTKAYVNGSNQGNYTTWNIVATKNDAGSITNQQWLEVGDEFPSNISFVNNQNITNSQWSLIDDFCNGDQYTDGIHIIIHAGHGGTLYNPYQPANLDNANTPNFVYTEGCTTADFGTDTNSRMEAWMKDDGAVVAGISNSAFGWFVASTYYVEEMMNQMFNDTTGNHTMKFCQAHNDAREIIGHDPDCVWGMIVKETNYFGDPALEYKWTSEFEGGDGTKGNPYQISKIEHLYNIRNHLDKNFTLINDLDFEDDDDYLNASHKPSNITGSGWLPIGNSTFPFTGSFNGDNHTINNLFINRSMISVGLFGVVGETGVNTEIYNIGITNANVSSNGWSSALVGYVYGYGSYINNSYSTGYINTTDNGAGGLIGYVWYGNINNCYSNATVDSMGNLGGLVGIVNTGTVKNSFSYGSVTDNNPASSSGGFIGHALGSNTFSNNFFDKQTSGFTTSDGATGKYTLDMQKYNTFNSVGWDIDTTPTVLNNEYPCLAWQNDTTTSTWLITLDSTQPTIISIDNKSNSSFVYFSTPTFNWTKIDSAVLYHIEIANDSAFTDLVVNLPNVCSYFYPTEYSENATAVIFTLPDTEALLYYKQYYVRIRARYSGGS